MPAANACCRGCILLRACRVAHSAAGPLHTLCAQLRTRPAQMAPSLTRAVTATRLSPSPSVSARWVSTRDQRQNQNSIPNYRCYPHVAQHAPFTHLAHITLMLQKQKSNKLCSPHSSVPPSGHQGLGRGRRQGKGIDTVFMGMQLPLCDLWEVQLMEAPRVSGHGPRQRARRAQR